MIAAEVKNPATLRRRYTDPQTQSTVVQIFQGDCYITNNPREMLTTILGSCVAACIRDPISGWGGMNHFLLPESSDGAGKALSEVSVSMRYGSYAMEQLINAILTRGALRENLEIKLFGGANVLRTMWGIGHANAEFVEQYLKNEGLRVAASHLRGNSPRKIQYFPVSGKVRMRELQENQDQIAVQFSEKLRPLRSRPAAGGTVELFD